MRTEPQLERLRVASLKELDALVGKYLTRETPRTFWEEQEVCLRFDSIEEALEAMRDPYIQEFIPKDSRSYSSLTEIQEFRPYSSDLSLAWEVVAQMSGEDDEFRVRCENGLWMATFGERPASVSRSPTVSICLAALLARGIEVEMISGWNVPAEEDHAVA